MERKQIGQLVEEAKNAGIRCEINGDGTLKIYGVIKETEAIRDEIREREDEVFRYYSGEPDEADIQSAEPLPKPKQFPYQPFPTDVLPPAIADYVKSAAESISCDPSFVALPALVTAATCIGNAVRFQVKSDWVEPCMLWMGIVAKPGDKKTPALSAATEPLILMQDELHQQYLSDLAEYKQQELRYKADLAQWKKKPDGEPPLMVEAIAEPRLWTSDATIEALGALLENNPRGVQYRSDELGQYLRSINEYKGAGGDLQRWLSIYNSQPISVDRKSSKPVHVRQPNVSIIGGIQPQLFRSFFSGEFIGGGLLQRFCYCWPPTKPAKLTKCGIKLQVKEAYAATLRRLQQMPFNGQSVDLPLSAEAWAMLEAWHDYIEVTYKPSVDNLLYEVASKLIATSVRLAGILMLTADGCAMEVNGEQMRNGVTLSRWFLDSWERAHALQSEAPGNAADRSLATFIAEKFGGEVTPAKLTAFRRDIDSASDAEARLMDLCKAGWGSFFIKNQPGKSGPNPRVFRLNPDVLSLS